MLYFADWKWWGWHKERAEYLAFAGEKATVFATGQLVDDPDVAMVRQKETSGMSADASEICTGFNSGHQVINIAALAGGEPIMLLGYDAQKTGGKAHYFGDHPDLTEAPYANMVTELRKAMPYFERNNIRLLNATPQSALTFLPKVSLVSFFSEVSK